MLLVVDQVLMKEYLREAKDTAIQRNDRTRGFKVWVLTAIIGIDLDYETVGSKRRYA